MKSDELPVHYYRGGVGKSNEKGGGVPLELGSRKGGFEGDAFLNQKAVFNYILLIMCIVVDICDRPLLDIFFTFPRLCWLETIKPSNRVTCDHSDDLCLNSSGNLSLGTCIGAMANPERVLYLLH